MRSVLTFVFICLLGATFASESGFVSYKDYKVWQVTPTSADQKDELYGLKERFGLDFWEHLHPGSASRVMVPPGYQSEFATYLENAKISGNIIIDDLERVFAREREVVAYHDARVKNERKMARKQGLRHTVDFEHFWPNEEILEYLDELAHHYPDTVEQFLVANSTQGRPVMGIKFSTHDLAMNGTRPVIFFDATVHAREWITPMMCLYLIHEYVEHYYDYEEILDEVDFIFIPVINVDGYEHTRNQNRLWRKTRSANEGSTCVGTDGNRNYEHFWNPGWNPCSDTWGGSAPFSEPEVAGVRDVFLEYGHNIKMYVSLHSYGNYVLYPWGYNAELVDNWEDHQRLGDDFADAVREVRGTNYRVGNSAILLYITYGDSIDYAADLGVPLNFVIELPGGGNYGFDIPSTEIAPVVRETMRGLDIWTTYIAENWEDLK